MIYNSKIDMHTCTLPNYTIAAHDHTYMAGVNNIILFVSDVVHSLLPQ